MKVQATVLLSFQAKTFEEAGWRTDAQRSERRVARRRP
jgi:hypothetical protein